MINYQNENHFLISLGLALTSESERKQKEKEWSPKQRRAGASTVEAR